MGQHLQEKLLEQSKREFRPIQRIRALAVEGVFFLALLPFVLIRLGSAVDHWFGWPVILYQPINGILGVLVIISGLLFAWWSIYVQFTIGRGTPVPLMATQKLIIQPPYAYCRNPMALGAIVAYLGVAILAGSPGALALVLLFAIALLTYIKRLEEKEMETRFGQEYLEYKRQTPFLLPRLRN